MRFYESILASLLLVTVEGLYAENVAYTAEGTLRYRSLFAKVQHDLLYPFQVAVSNELWSITVDLQNRGNLRHSTQVFDGSNIVGHAYFAAKKDVDGVVIVEASEQPSPDVPGFAEYIWLTYASQATFAGKTSGWIRPIIPTSVEKRASKQKTPATWTTNTTLPFLPNSVTYQYFDTASGKAALWATYTVTEHLLEGSLCIPKAATLIAYEAMSEMRGKGQLPVFQVDVNTKAVRRTSNPLLSSKDFVGRAVVDDMRFMDGSDGRLTYKLTNSAPYSSDNPLILLLMSQESLGRQENKERRATKQRFATVAFYALVGVASAFFAVLAVKTCKP